MWANLSSSFSLFLGYHDVKKNLILPQTSNHTLLSPWFIKITRSTDRELRFPVILISANVNLSSLEIVYLMCFFFFLTTISGCCLVYNSYAVSFFILYTYLPDPILKKQCQINWETIPAD